ncbi:MAG: hypothetical protein EOP83_00075 [Verrucomicrobiaceae bacterium]|nr:MAG: hypothetical protein EOP83_00075 [Verrucomicrobiaceae bacterium]
MKPSVLVINPTGSVPAPWVEALCNQWMEDCYVYLLCPGCGFREDNPRGVRFLSHDGDAVPNFGQLEAIVTFERTDALDRLMETYPEVLVRMIPRVGDALPDQVMPSASPLREHPLAA